MKNTLVDYVNKARGDLQKIVDQQEVILKITKMFRECRTNNGTVFFCGNGGSSSTASHLAQDFQKMCGIRTVCLSDNTPLVTAWSNDENYESVFMEQLKKMASPSDILVVFSGSGNSKNIIKAMDWSLCYDLGVVAFIGMKGGEVKRMKREIDSIVLFHVDTDMQHSEDLHMIVGHLILRLLM